MKKFIIIMAFLMFQFSIGAFAQSTFADSLVKKYPIKSNEAIGIIFLDPSSCVKCQLNPENLFLEAMREAKKDMDIIFFVACDRKKEADYFKKKLNLKYDFEPDLKHQTRKKLGCDAYTDVCVINSKGDVIAKASTNFKSEKENLEVIVEALKKLK